MIQVPGLKLCRRSKRPTFLMTRILVAIFCVIVILIEKSFENITREEVIQDSFIKEPLPTIKKEARPTSISEKTSIVEISRPVHTYESLVKLPTMHAVIHVGPHKTGTTSIQSRSANLVHSLLTDGYEMPWSRIELEKQTYGSKRDRASSNQVRFATCFLKSGIRKMNVFLPKVMITKIFPCQKDLLQSGREVAKDGHSLLVSAETFDHLNDSEVKALSEYLHPWEKVTIVVTYRRYYDWLISYHNQLSKFGPQNWVVFQKKANEKLRPSILDSLSDPAWLETLKNRHTFYVARRFKQQFQNVVVMNMHDETKDLVEDFYCNALPNAPNACKTLKHLQKFHNKNTCTSCTSRLNKSLPFVYDDIAYAANKKGLINIQSKEHYIVAKDAIRAYQETKTNLGLSSAEFKMNCPPQDILQELLNASLEAEKDLLPEFFASSHGEMALMSDFEKKSNSTLCEVDVESTLEDVGWKDFLASLNAKLIDIPLLSVVNEPNPLHHHSAPHLYGF